MAKGGGTYDHFMEYIDTFIDKGDVQSLISDFGGDKYQNNPEEMLKKLDEFFMDKWKEGVAAGRSQPSGRAAQQEENFRAALQKTILNKKGFETQFQAPYGQPVDWDPLIAPYKDATGQFFIPKKVPPKTKAFLEKGETVKLTTIDQRTGEKRPKYYYTPSSYNRKVASIAERADLGRNVDSLIALRDQQERIFKTGKGPISSSDAYLNMIDLNKRIDKYRDQVHQFSLKSDTDLREILAWKGVDITTLDTTEKLRNAARKEGIGLRKYQKTKDELIKDLTDLTTITREQVEAEKWTKAEVLKKLKENHKGIGYAPKRVIRVPLGQLRTDDSTAETVWNTTPNLPNFEAEKQKFIEREKSIYPFLNQEELNKRANQQLIAEARGAKVYDNELLRRFLKYDTKISEKPGKKVTLQWTKRESPKEQPTYADLKKLQHVTHKDFKLYLSADENLPREEKYLTKDLFTQYRNDLRDKVGRAEKIFEETRGPQQEEQFIRESLQNTGLDEDTLEGLGL